MTKLLALDPSMANFGWALAETRADNSLQYINSGVFVHGFKGKGEWNAKIMKQVEQALGLLDYNPDRVYVEVPAFGSRGKGTVATMNILMTTMEVAWSTAFHMKRMRPRLDIYPMKPDNKKKEFRGRMVEHTIRGWPAETKDHETDAAYLLLRNPSLALMALTQRTTPR